MLDFIWPKTGKQVKIRVLIALTLLLVSKVKFQSFIFIFTIKLNIYSSY